MNALDRARAAFEAMALSSVTITQALEANSSIAANSASSFAQATEPLRAVTMPRTAEFQSLLSDLALNLSLQSREVEFCVGLDSALLRDELLSGIELPPDTGTIKVETWTGPVDRWGDTASLRVEIAGGLLAVPLQASMHDNLLQVAPAGPPVFQGSPLARSIFANVITGRKIFGERVKLTLPSLHFGSVSSRLARAHVREGAVRLFSSGRPNSLRELAPRGVDSYGLTFFLTPNFLVGLLTSLTGYPIGAVSVDPDSRSLQLTMSMHKSEGLDGVCTLEVTLTTLIRLRLSLRSSSVISAHGWATKQTLSWDLDGLVCDISEKAARALASALGQDLASSVTLPTPSQPFNRDLRCQGVRLSSLGWRPSGVAIHFRKSTLAGELMCT